MLHSASLRKQPFILASCCWGLEERGETAIFKCRARNGPLKRAHKVVQLVFFRYLFFFQRIVIVTVKCCATIHTGIFIQKCAT